MSPLLRLMARGQCRDIRKRVAPVIERLPGGTDADSLCRKVITNAVVRGLDDLLMSRLLKRHLRGRVRFEGAEILDSALSQGKGAILLGGHFFAGRLAKRYLAACGYPLLTVRYPLPDDYRAGRFAGGAIKRRYLRFLSGVIGEQVHPQDRDCGLRILSHLRRGGVVSILMDGCSSRDLCKLPFLGKMCQFPAGFLQVALLADAPILPMLTTGNSQELMIRIWPGLTIDNHAETCKVGLAILPDLVRWLEAEILLAPDQWELWTRM